MVYKCTSSLVSLGNDRQRTETPRIPASMNTKYWIIVKTFTQNYVTLPACLPGTYLCLQFLLLNLCGSIFTTTLDIKEILRSEHTVYLWVLCGSQNKKRLFPYTALTDWFLQLRFNPLKPIGHYIYHQFNIQQLDVLHTQCIYGFCVDLRTNRDYFLIQR